MKTTEQIIRERLDKLGWKDADLARAINMSRQNLGHILSGRRMMSTATFHVIDNVLDLRTDMSSAKWPGSERNSE